MKNIGFDVDGVLTDIEKFQLEYGKKFFKEKYGMDIVNREGYSIKEIFNCSDEQEYAFWEKNIVHYALKYPIRCGASEIINRLMEDGNNIYIISSRIKASEKSALGAFMRTLLKKWLIRNNINIDEDKFFFCSIKNSGIEKARVCKEQKIDFMIEDCPTNIQEIKSVTNVIAYSASYNKNIPTDVTRVKSFHELYDIISNTYETNNFKFLRSSQRAMLSRNELLEYYKKLRDFYINSKTKIDVEKTERFYSIVYPLLKKVFDFKYPCTVENVDRIPDNSGVIFVANHSDMIDPPLIMSVLGNRPVHLLLKAEFLNSKFSSFLTKLGFVFVERGNRDSEILSSEELSKLVARKKDIIIFPEGTRNKTNEVLLEFKKGAVTIAQRTGAPIVPLAITKVFDDFKEKIVIKVGEPMYVDYFDDLREKNQELREQIEEMILSTNAVKIKRR